MLGVLSPGLGLRGGAGDKTSLAKLGSGKAMMGVA